MANYDEYEKLGGDSVIIKVVKEFYDLVYADAWIGLYFREIPQDVIESQQVDFMRFSLGGENKYLGKLPIPAHKHMFITNELFDLRQKLLTEAMDKVGISEELRTKWLRIDEAFRGKLVKNNPSECEKRFATDEILDFRKAG